MPGKPPVLDNRKLEDILKRLGELANGYVPEWTPPADGDVGVMLQRIFARLLEITLDRLNRVPEKNVVAFLDTMGIALLPPSPARAPVTLTLKDGSDATAVSEGMQIGAQSSESGEEVVFETDQDIIVIPAKLSKCFTMDPTWDRYTDQTSVLAGQSSNGFAAFVGSKRIPHILYVGDGDLLNFSKTPNVRVSFQAQSTDLASIEWLFGQLSYEYQSEDADKTAIPALSMQETQLILEFGSLSSIDQTTLQGIGIVDGIQGRWLRCVLPIPIPDVPLAHSLELTNPMLVVTGSGLAPDLAYNDDIPLDITRDFYPFGESPTSDSIFYISSQEAFSKPDATLTLNVGVKPADLPTLIWESQSAALESWIQIPSNNISDITDSLTQSGTISMPRPANMRITNLFGIDAYWLRVRIGDGNYRGVPQINQLQLVVVPTGLQQPAASGAIDIVLTDPEFADTDDVILIEDEFLRVIAAEQNFMNVRPSLERDHVAGDPVEYMGTLSGTIATLRGPINPGQDFMIVLARDNILESDILLIDDPEQPEFVKVRALTSSGRIYRIDVSPSLKSGHKMGTSILRVESGLHVYAERQKVGTGEAFYPFSAQPGPGYVLHIGRERQFQHNIRFGVGVQMDPPNVRLAWEYLGNDSWHPFVPSQETTNSFTEPGIVRFSSRPTTESEVNSQKGYWIRARISSGNYGKAVEYEQVDPDDPKKGFRVKPGTGNLDPPVITSLTTGYQAQRPPTVATQNGFIYANYKGDNAFTPFVPITALSPGYYRDTQPALYLGFDSAYSQKPVTLYVSVAPRVFSGRVIKGQISESSSSSSLPSLKWEYYSSSGWKELTIIDNTNNLSESGTVAFLTPSDMLSLAKFDLTEYHWIRALSPENDPQDTQRLTGVYINTVPATQGATVTDEILGSSSRLENQSFNISNTPVLSGQKIMILEQNVPPETERIEIENEEGEDAIEEHENTGTGETEIWVRWHEVANFLQSYPYSRHYTIDRENGTVKFGDGEHGLVPPKGTNNIVAAEYRYGGGTAGNEEKEKISQIKTSVTGIASATNPVSSDGGANIETTDMVKERGPQTLKHRNRSVTSSDLEWLAKEAVGTLIARAKCLPNINRNLEFEPGWTTLIIVPNNEEPKPMPSAELVRQVENFLEENTFVGLSQTSPARINVIGPGYIQVAIEAQIVPRNIQEAEDVKEEVLSVLDAFLHPLTGGPDGTGWIFGRDVYASEICKIIEDITSVSYVKSLDLIPNVAQNWVSLGAPLNTSPGLSDGCIVRTPDGRKSYLLAEALTPGTSTQRISVKGFKEGDRIAKAQDFVITQIPDGSQTLVHPVIEVGDTDGAPFSSDSVGFPLHSLVITTDGRNETRLAAAILPDMSGQTDIVIEDADFLEQLQIGDRLTVLYPFHMTVTSVEMAGENRQILGVEAYETEAAFPEGSIITTLDNSVRLPLAEEVATNEDITSVTVTAFTSEDRIVIPELDEIQATEIVGIQTINQVVYLDGNFLAYPGRHVITLVAILLAN